MSESSSPSPAKPRPRASGSQTRQRTHQAIGVYDDREWARFEVSLARYRKSAAADDYGDSVAAFIRWQTIGAGARKLPARRSNPELPADLAQQIGAVMTELMRQGHNLNQIARHLHTDGYLPAATLETALNEHRDTLRVLRRLAGIED